MEYNFNKQKLTKIERIKYFFKKPSKLFEEINIETCSEFYFILIMLFSAITSFVNSTFLKDILNQTIIDSLRKTIISIHAPEYAELLTTPSIQIITTMIFLCVSLFFTSFLYFIIILLLSRKEKYKPVFSEVFNIYLIASLVTSIGNIIKSLFMFATNNPVFLKTTDKTSFNSILINQFYPFLFLKMFLLIMGFTIVFKFSIKKSTLAVLAVWVGTIGMLFI